MRKNALLMPGGMGTAGTDLCITLVYVVAGTGRGSLTLASSARGDH